MNSVEIAGVEFSDIEIAGVALTASQVQQLVYVLVGFLSFVLIVLAINLFTKNRSSDAGEKSGKKSGKKQEKKEPQYEEIFEIDIDDTTYCTNNEENGFIYELNNGEMGDKIGYLKDGEPFFYADEN